MQDPTRKRRIKTTAATTEGSVAMILCWERGEIQLKVYEGGNK
jgi:hypothetical protein